MVTEYEPLVRGECAGRDVHSCSGAGFLADLLHGDFLHDVFDRHLAAQEDGRDAWMVKKSDRWSMDSSNGKVSLVLCLSCAHRPNNYRLVFKVRLWHHIWTMIFRYIYSDPHCEVGQRWFYCSWSNGCCHRIRLHWNWNWSNAVPLLGTGKKNTHTSMVMVIVVHLLAFSSN